MHISVKCWVTVFLSLRTSPPPNKRPSLLLRAYMPLLSKSLTIRLITSWQQATGWKVGWGQWSTCDAPETLVTSHMGPVADGAVLSTHLNNTGSSFCTFVYKLDKIFNDSKWIFLGTPRYNSLGVQPLTLTTGECSHDKSSMTLLIWLSFLGQVSIAFTWHLGVKGGWSNGPSMVSSQTSVVT